MYVTTFVSRDLNTRSHAKSKAIVFGRLPVLWLNLDLMDEPHIIC